MKSSFSFRSLLLLTLVLSATCPTQAQSPSHQETLQQYISELQGNPGDLVLRKTIIKLAQEITPALTIPAEAEKFGNRAEYAIKNAKSNTDFIDAINEYEKALLTAPWVSAYYYNLAIAYEKIDQPEETIRNYKFYLLAEPNAQDAQEVRKQIDGLEFAIEKKEKAEKEQKEQMARDRVFIPAGEFIAHPVRKVFLNDYYIDKYEVTVAQYRKFCEATGKDMPPPPPWGWQDDQPVVNVSLDDATAYAQYYGKRLPTSAEWERAGRIIPKARYSFGNSAGELPNHAWFANNSGGKPNKVGTKTPNALGLYDMHGNVGEWTSDLHDYHAFDPKIQPSGTYPQYRGGTWNTNARMCAFDVVFTVPLGKGSSEIGFRCASSP